MPIVTPEPRMPAGRTLPLPPATAVPAVLFGEPDLRATRGLCFGSAALCTGFGVGLPLAVIAAADRLAPRDALLVCVLGVGLALLMLGLALYLLRAGLSAGAWFRIDARGFSYGNGRPGTPQVPGTALQRFDWSDLRRNPEHGVDVALGLQPRYGVLNPDLTFWQRDRQGLLRQRCISLSLRDDALRCLRFRNAHALRVALLQGLARQGLRFESEVFVEAGVDPQSWQPMPGPRRRRWLLALGSIGLLSLSVLAGWPLPLILLAALASLGFACAATGALARHAEGRGDVIRFSAAPDEARRPAD